MSTFFAENFLRFVIYVAMSAAKIFWIEIELSTRRFLVS